MKLSLRNPVTVKRIYIVCVLIFLENFLIPLIDIMGGNQWPTVIQVTRIGFASSLQVVTILFALLKIER